MDYVQMRYLAFASLVFFVFTSLHAEDRFTIDLGPHKVILKTGSNGLAYFPDQPIAVIRENPFTFLLTANNGKLNGTFVMQGTTFGDTRPVSTFLKPTSNSFDNGYTGCGAVYFNQSSNEYICLYHAEDHEGGKVVPYNKALRSTHWSIGMVSVDAKTNKSTRHGQALLGETKKNEIVDDHRGIGDPSITVDPTGKYLYAYYTDLNRKVRLPATICMARCLVSDGGRPGKWTKYFEGQFSQSGLGGKESPVVEIPGGPDTIGPHVVYVASMKRYFMVCNVVYFSDIQQQESERSGIYWTHSSDGLRWEQPEKLIVGQSVPQIGKNYTGHPTLVVESSTATSLKGQLLYCFSSSWGTSAPHSPHQLAGRSISIQLQSVGSQPPSSTRLSVDELLKAAKSSKKNPQGEVVEIDLSKVKLGDAEIATLSQMVSLRRVTAPDSGLSDDHISRLANLSNVTSLGLWQTRITDEGLKTIGKMANLSYLSVEGNRGVTNEGLAHLSGCKKLSWLGLSYTGISDDGMKHLVGLPLTRLDVTNTAITDDGLLHFARIGTLKTLTLTRTRVTDAGVQKLKGSLPKCQITR
jgi:hypothetical protein